jgi:hypothetical protein
MRASVDIDPEIEKQLTEAQQLTGEKQATVIRLALRAGLPHLIHRFQPARPEGYFSGAYEQSEDTERISFERKMSRVTRQRLER